MNNTEAILLTNVILGTVNRADFLAVSYSYEELHKFFDLNRDLLSDFNLTVFRDQTLPFFDIESIGVESDCRIHKRRIQ